MRILLACLVSALASVAMAGCDGDDASSPGAAGSSGVNGGSAGSSGVSGGSAGSSGTSGGTAGSSTGGSGGGSGTGGASGATGCETVSCEAVDCGPTRPKYTPLGECCPRCGPDCAVIDCRPLNCGPSVVPYTPPGLCCPICGPAGDCANVTCADVACPQGTTLIPPEAGQCCGTCVGEDGPLCDPAGYRAFRDRLIAERGAQRCGPTDHCAAFGINARCEVDCGTATLADQAAPLASSLLAFAEMMCRGCPMPEPCPPRRFTPACVNGACALAPP